MKGMINLVVISEIASYIPDIRLSNYSKKAVFDISDDFIHNTIGVEYVSRKMPDEDTSDMCYKSFVSLLEKVVLHKDEIECIIVCTQNPDNEGMPNTASILHSKIKAREDCAAFDISIGCSGYVYGLSIISAFMEANNLSKGLLFTCDPLSKIINEEDKNTSLLFGDAATVTLLENVKTKSNSFSPSKFIFSTRGEAEALKKETGILKMNGRAVFNFAITEVPIQITKLLEREAIHREDIDIYIFHQGSKYMVRTLQKELELCQDKVPCNIQNHGNTSSSSIPLILKDYLNNQSIKKILLSGFGIGLSWASCLLVRD